MFQRAWLSIAREKKNIQYLNELQSSLCSQCFFYFHDFSYCCAIKSSSAAYYLAGTMKHVYNTLFLIGCSVLPCLFRGGV